MAYEELRKLQAPLKRKRRRRRIKIALIILGALGALFAGWHIYLVAAKWAEAGALRKTGYPATLAELNAWYPTPPPGENAADALTQAFAKYDYTKADDDLPIVGGGRFPEAGQPIPAELKARVSDYLTRNAAAIDLVRKGATMPKCRYPIDLGRFYASSFGSHLPKLRQGARLMKLETRLCLENHDAKGATESVITIFGLAKSLRTEPTLISHLTETVLDDVAMSALQDVLAGMNLDNDQLPRLAAAMEAEQENCRTGLVRGYAGDAALSLHAPDRRVWGQDNAFRRRFRRIMGLSAEDRIAIAKELRADAALAKRSFSERLGVCRQLEQKAAQASPVGSRRQLEFAGMRNCIVNEAEAVARLRAAVTATAVERFRNANGRLPATLTELVPKDIKAIPEDPFDGKPLRYVVQGNSYIVYSVGNDLVDNGGAPRNVGANFDITFTVDRQTAGQTPSPAASLVIETQ